MKKEILNLPNVKQPDYPYNQVVKAGNTLYLSGQVSCDLQSGQFILGNIEIQTKNALENIKYLLENSNSSMNNILKVVVYMKNIFEVDKMNEIYKMYFKKNELPTRVAIQTTFPNKNIEIELEVVALTN
ncbi:2-iminobutanoate/2-iminopropanoate deaminase [Clostridium saccharoperbutylacetonicum]|jgi:2-iminobutanoate/2-iminopropanoate deaminase|uniref:Putative translation initiation inhibitor, yjgF family n=1 Tax=Clostridium saccharoperbutylacetonicum N1-4(HMT) TaxID=931276 RepID=M1MW26_9CLOT|nr:MULTISPECIES: RidA family protein [Clostridium]AGF55702.1 putative translation initiation inhibitor, yjgF family [Clostridium saccharoperbutylacetonicum N1-4(HMT)]NRT63570.1 2-iminobutanoate/2-iminopropanoate deaminase [Clostridium saccharoperbutylacetonicum]NSB26933.1 2-iminobutanoate/2-iminopropanoate deaminase [Clostridium saccharoperbutylacetonicum]NSB30243.1 2-iminobutanoate/2-iminopropanoate deaminase [Clostridium saccharoperbutylacetonicum]NSB40417.1 2-iminobutanoate/2-iminopropanoat